MDIGTDPIVSPDNDISSQEQHSLFGPKPATALPSPSPSDHEHGTHMNDINNGHTPPKSQTPPSPPSQPPQPTPKSRSPDISIHRTPSPVPTTSSNTSDLESDSDSDSDSPPPPDFNAPAKPAKETISYSRSNILPDLRAVSAIINATKRRAAILGQQHRVGGCAAIDQDDSGTYDPSEERRRSRGNGKSCKKSGEAGVKKVSVKTAGATKRERSTKENGFFSLKVTISLEREEALRYLRDITPGVSGIEREGEEDDGDGDGDAEGDEVGRSRRKKMKTDHHRRSDGRTLEELTNGHPQRRGCKSCFLNGNDNCSLLSYPAEYPCEDCEGEEKSCELIIPPEYKRTCEQCRYKRIASSCSYRTDGGVGVDSCDTCKEKGIKCIAGPGKEPKSMRIDDILGTSKGTSSVVQKEKVKGHPTTKITTTQTMSQPSQKSKAQSRKWASCNSCRALGARCSLKRDEEGPCSRCSKEGTGCTFTYSEPQRDSKPSINIPTSVKQPLIASASASSSSSSSKSRGRPSESNDTPLKSAVPDDDLTRTLVHEATHLSQRKFKQKSTKVQRKAYAHAQATSSCSHSYAANAQAFPSPFSARSHRNSIQNKKSLLAGERVGSQPPNLIGFHNGAEIITIKTSFVHPIIFNWSLPPDTHPSHDAHPSCDFHTNPFFGLLGHGPARDVQVIPYPNINGNGYEEVENGYGEPRMGDDGVEEEAFPRTRMCVRCTWQRTKILGCRGNHSMQVLKGVDPLLWKQDVLCEMVLATKEGKINKGEKGYLLFNAKWCAICPSIAAYVCKWEVEVLDENGGWKKEKGGCGLLLCTVCNKLWGKVKQNPTKDKNECFERFVDLVEQAGEGKSFRKSSYPDGARADVGWLRENGELAVRMGKGGCQEVRPGEEDERRGERTSFRREVSREASVKSVGSAKSEGKKEERRYTREEMETWVPSSFVESAGEDEDMGTKEIQKSSVQGGDGAKLNGEKEVQEKKSIQKWSPVVDPSDDEADGEDGGRKKWKGKGVNRSASFERTAKSARTQRGKFTCGGAMEIDGGAMAAGGTSTDGDEDTIVVERESTGEKGIKREENSDYEDESEKWEFAKGEVVVLDD